MRCVRKLIIILYIRGNDSTKKPETGSKNADNE